MELDYDAAAISIVKRLSPVLADTWTLSLDRSNWTARRNEVNLLTLGVCLGDVAAALFWVDLRRRGSSPTRQRTALVQRFIQVFETDRIGLLPRDRECARERWFGWLQRKKIAYVMRLRGSFMVMAGNGRQSQVRSCLRNIKVHEYRQLGTRRVCGRKHRLSAVRLPEKKFAILAGFMTQQDVTDADLYLRRCNIETGFEKLKAHGFNLEATRLSGEGKMEVLMAGLAVAMAWCYAVGEGPAR